MRRRLIIATLAIIAAALAVASGCGADDGEPESRSCTTIDDDADIEGGATLDEDCYEITDPVTIDRGELEIAAGTTLYFDRHAGLSVEGPARLLIDGAEDDPVELRGDTAQLGFWRGIKLDSSGPHRISHARIRHAGSQSWDDEHAPARGALVVFADSAQLEVADTEFDHNEFAALSTASPVAEVEISTSHFADNDVPLRLHPNHAGAVDSNNSFSDNRRNVVVVHTDEPISRVSTWQPLTVPYEVEEAIPVESLLVIEPGTTVAFGRDAGLDVDGGLLEADAYDAAAIHFVGARQNRGYWQGLRFRNTPDPDHNIMTNVEVLHGGSQRWDSNWSNSQANILVHDGGRLHIDHAYIADGDYHGISTRNAIVAGCDSLEYDNLYRHREHSYDGDDVCFE